MTKRKPRTTGPGFLSFRKFRNSDHMTITPTIGFSVKCLERVVTKNLFDYSHSNLFFIHRRKRKQSTPGHKKLQIRDLASLYFPHPKKMKKKQPVFASIL